MKPSTTNKNLITYTNYPENNNTTMSQDTKYISDRFCNNCGKKGHLFQKCKHPIASIGIIAFRYNITKKDYEFLLICRKHSLGYMDFIRGKYNIYNKQHILNLLEEMTEIEKNAILKLDFATLWNHLWENKNISRYKNERFSASQKLEHLRKGVQVKSESYSLQTLLQSCKSYWVEPEWGFPKGRREYREKDIETALREFTEETGYKKNEVDIIENIMPFEETFMGSNYKSYKHKYFLAKIMDTVYDLSNFEQCEVSKLEWHTLKECLYRIRYYNGFRGEILKNVLQLVKTYEIV